MENWIARINDKLDQLGLFPDVEACAISDMAGHFLLVDTQQVTVYTSAEGCYRLLAHVERADEEHDTFDAIGQALHPHLVEDIWIIDDHGDYRRDPQQPTDAEREALAAETTYPGPLAEHERLWEHQRRQGTENTA